MLSGGLFINGCSSLIGVFSVGIRLVFIVTGLEFVLNRIIPMLLFIVKVVLVFIIIIRHYFYYPTIVRYLPILH